MQYYFSKPQGRRLQCQFCCYSDYPRRIKLTVAYKSNLFWNKYFWITHWISEWADILLQPQHNKITLYTLPFKRKHTFPAPPLLIAVFLLNIDGPQSIRNNKQEIIKSQWKRQTRHRRPCAPSLPHNSQGGEHAAGLLKYYSLLVEPDRDRHHTQTCFCIMLWIKKSTPWQFVDFDINISP